MSQVDVIDATNENPYENLAADSLRNRLMHELSKQSDTNSKKNVRSQPFKNRNEDPSDKDGRFQQKLSYNLSYKPFNATPKSIITHIEKTTSRDAPRQKSKDEPKSSSSSVSHLMPSRGKESPHANSTIKPEIMSVLKPSSVHQIKMNISTPIGAKPNRTPSGPEKISEFASKPSSVKVLDPKPIDKKSRSAASSQDKMLKKRKEKYESYHRLNESPSLQTQGNETIIYISSALDKMLDKSPKPKLIQALDKEKRPISSYYCSNNDNTLDLEMRSPMKDEYESLDAKMKLSTAPLSTYFQLSKAGNYSEKPDIHGINFIDIEGRENHIDLNPRLSLTTTHKDSRRVINVPNTTAEAQSIYGNLQLEKIPDESPKLPSDGSKSATLKRTPSHAGSLPRHQTPTAKTYNDLSQGVNDMRTQYKGARRTEKSGRPEFNEQSLVSLQQNRSSRPSSRGGLASSKSNSSTKGAARELPNYLNYPVYNNLVIGEYMNSNQTDNNRKTQKSQTILDHRSYESTSHQVDKRQSMSNRNKEELSKYGGAERGIEEGELVGKNKRDEYKIYNVYNFESRKLV